MSERTRPRRAVRVGNRAALPLGDVFYLVTLLAASVLILRIIKGQWPSGAAEIAVFAIVSGILLLGLLATRHVLSTAFGGGRDDPDDDDGSELGWLVGDPDERLQVSRSLFTGIVIAIGVWLVQSELSESVDELKTASKVQSQVASDDLTGTDLQGADLESASLGGKNLSEADLEEADLREATLVGSDLTEANLIGADLRDAELTGATLADADLREADLRSADLEDADLSGADLTDADLEGADLQGARLDQAILDGTNLSEANLELARVDPGELMRAVINQGTVCPNGEKAQDPDSADPDSDGPFECRGVAPGPRVVVDVPSFIDGDGNISPDFSCDVDVDVVPEVSWSGVPASAEQVVILLARGSDISWFVVVEPFDPPESRRGEDSLLGSGTIRLDRDELILVADDPALWVDEIELFEAPCVDYDPGEDDDSEDAASSTYTLSVVALVEPLPADAGGSLTITLDEARRIVDASSIRGSVVGRVVDPDAIVATTVTPDD